jgi:hypothetical protein
MGKRRADADNRRFFDEFEKVRVSRFRAMGVIDPAKRTALIPFPGGKTKLIYTAHTKLKYGGGWSFFVCPKCGKLAVQLWLIDDAPLCTKCCDAMNIKHASKWAFGRDGRRQASDNALDQLVAKVETTVPLRFKPAPAHWRGKTKRVTNSQSLILRMQRSMIILRLNQLADQHESQRANKRDSLKAYQPTTAARQLVNTTPIWRANSSETLAQALDNAQSTILAALNGNDPRQRLIAAKLMLRTKQARERGL